MQIDKTTLDRLLSLDDVTLAKTINMLSSAAGIPKEAANAAIKNMRIVRASLSNATDADIEKAMNILGEERATAIKNVIDAQKNDGN